MTISPITFIRKQIKAARAELNAYPPTDIDWYQRARRTANRIVPWLTENAPLLVEYVSAVMNSPIDVRASASALIDKLATHPEFASDSETQKQIASLSSSLNHESLLISGAGGTVVSKLIERFLIERSQEWELESNGASDYPDLFIRSDDYTALPSFRRGAEQEYGAALKGKSKRPVRIPDGLEIKTCRKTFAVDCHHAHVGLHLVLVYERQQHRFVVTDVRVGFMRHSLYRITVPSSPTTTLKASFNGHNFVSIRPETPH